MTSTQHNNTPVTVYSLENDIGTRSLYATRTKGDVSLIHKFDLEGIPSKVSSDNLRTLEIILQSMLRKMMLLEMSRSSQIRYEYTREIEYGATLLAEIIGGTKFHWTSQVIQAENYLK